MEVLSEHQCQGWLEGYLLTGRHGLFNCYEAFIHIVDSMFNQHAKWLKVTRDIPWRRPIASLNYLLELARLAPGPQRLQPPGPRLHRPRGQQEGRASSGSTCRPTRTRCCRSATTACAAATTSTSSSPASSPRPNWLSMDQAILHCTARHRDLGLGQQRPGRRAGRRHGLRRRHPDARDAGRRRPAPPAPAGPQGPRRQRRRPDAAPAASRSTRTACPTASSTRCSRPTGRSSSPTTATRG